MPLSGSQSPQIMEISLTDPPKILPRAEYAGQRNNLLTDLSNRLRQTMVSICMGCSDANAVRGAFENVLFAVENYCDFLDKNICSKEETTTDADEEPPITEEQLQQRRRDGIRPT